MPRSFLLKRFILKHDWEVTDKVPDLYNSEGMLNYAGVKDGRRLSQVDVALECQALDVAARSPFTEPGIQIDSLEIASLQWRDADIKKSSEEIREDSHRRVVKAPSSQQSPNNDVTAIKSDLPTVVKRSQPANKRQSSAGSQKKETYRCDQCGKIFKTKYTLTIHLKMPSHTGARPFVCAICGKGFRLSSTLCRHKIIHTTHKPHQCSICSKAFNRSSTLKTHQRTHSEVKEFTCSICHKGFHQKGNLRNHLLIHTGEKPYKCHLCHKAFNKLSNLKFHTHVHTDNRPYRCRYCKITFTRRCDLKDHLAACSKQERGGLKRKTENNA